MFCREAATARIALGEYFKARGVYKLDGDLTIVRAAVIQSPKSMEAVGVFNDPLLMIGIAFKQGEAVLVCSGGLFEKKGKVMRDTPADARVPVEFDFGMFGRFPPHQVIKLGE